ncbi:MAG TPA: hypothetical protein VGG72_17405 [Bryobacteraceae bacterium]|jgi:hypothetical protein
MAQYQAGVETEVVAKGDYFKAVAGLDGAVGRIREINNISVDEAYSGRLSNQPSAPRAP